MDYNYKEGKKRILDIINDSNEMEEIDKIPTDSEFTFDNGYYGWVTALFVDIRNSTKLFSENRKTSTAKIIRCFTSEIIEILSNDPNLREIGIRGDCVYSIYASFSHKTDLEILNKAFFVNTYMKMLNKILTNKNMKNIKAGIGIATHKDLVIKAGRKGKDINNKVWIGEAVTFSSKLSNCANKNGNSPILMSSEFYNSIIEKYKETRNISNTDSFIKYNDSELGTVYGCDLVKAEFNDWINGGMRDE